MRPGPKPLGQHGLRDGHDASLLRDGEAARNPQFLQAHGNGAGGYVVGAGHHALHIGDVLRGVSRELAYLVARRGGRSCSTHGVGRFGLRLRRRGAAQQQAQPDNKDNYLFHKEW